MPAGRGRERGPCGECGGNVGSGSQYGAYVCQGGAHVASLHIKDFGGRERGWDEGGGVSGESCEHWSLKKIGLKNRKGLQAGGSE